MGEPLPVFPAAMSALAQPTTGPAHWHATRVTAALLSFCAVVLVIVGSFLPLYEGTISFGGDDIEVTITPWSADVRGPTEPGDVPTIGYPLVFAAIVLACAAAISWYAATPAGTPGVGRVAGLTTAIGGAFLIGTVWTTSLMVTNGVDSVLLLGTVTPGLETEATYLVGYWLLLVAALSSLGAAVLALIPVRRPTWVQANPDVSTPPYGIAPVALPGRPPGTLQVDPLTGRPLAGPYPPPPAAWHPQPNWQAPPHAPATAPPPVNQPRPDQQSALQSPAGQAPEPPVAQPSPLAEPPAAQPSARRQSAMQSLAAQEPPTPPAAEPPADTSAPHAGPSTTQPSTTQPDRPPGRDHDPAAGQKP